MLIDLQISLSLNHRIFPIPEKLELTLRSHVIPTKYLWLCAFRCTCIFSLGNTRLGEEIGRSTLENDPVALAFLRGGIPHYGGFPCTRSGETPHRLQTLLLTDCFRLRWRETSCAAIRVQATKVSRVWDGSDPSEPITVIDGSNWSVS